ncbi:RNA methyltransferase [Teredinibacter waterburyi]|uniref:RNA methyltransferase n=1 Tax=Teredinibacter waterburyi TaxID=1500538 RepID=UPI00165FEA0F|nr:RNA methyltransferase [Teredinibacter waterburyi]
MINSCTYIGLCNPKSPSNVGSVMRAAGCFQADAVFYTGSRYGRAARFHTDTHQQSLSIPLEPRDNLLADLPENVKIVCVELVEGATSLTEYQHPDRAIYIFGPEDGSISQQLVDAADDVVYIPTVNCLNLAATVNVVLYDRLAKQDTAEAGIAEHSIGDDLICKSRDINNRLRVTK